MANILAHIRLLIVLRPMTNKPHFRHRERKRVKPMNSKVSGFPFSKLLPTWGAGRPKRIRQVLSGCNATGTFVP
jgi:hypothetical protein